MMSYLWILLLGSLLAASAKAEGETPTEKADAPDTPATGTKPTHETASIVKPTVLAAPEATKDPDPTTPTPKAADPTTPTPKAADPTTPTPKAADPTTSEPGTTEEATPTPKNEETTAAADTTEGTTTTPATTKEPAVVAETVKPTENAGETTSSAATTTAKTSAPETTSEAVADDKGKTTTTAAKEPAIQPEQAKKQSRGFAPYPAPENDNPGKIPSVDSGAPPKTAGATGGEENTDQPQAASSSSIAGILSAIAVAVVGAIVGYFTYQKKKLCFKNRQEADPEAARKADAAEAQQDPQVLSNLLNSS